ncbi:MAG TPA: hypothetical protein V6D29_10980 [Leptolyngbyaceae cyanobacterium]
MADSSPSKIATQRKVVRTITTGLVGLGLSLFSAPAQADTVVISTGGFAISAPNFFLSVGNPVVFYPTVVSYPSVIYSPSYFLFPQPYPIHQSLYPASTYPPLAIDDAISPPVQPDGVVGTPTVITNPVRYTLTNNYVVRSDSPDPIARFTSNTMPWVGVQDLSTSREGVTPGSPSSPLQPGTETTDYQISSPDPFNQSLRSLDQ